MFLLVSWKNSLNLLIKPNNAYLLFLVSLKAAFDGLRLLLPLIIGWFIGIVLVFFVKEFIFFEYFSGKSWGTSPHFYSFDYDHYTLLFLLLISLAVHPSVTKKRINSFFSFNSIKLYFAAMVMYMLLISLAVPPSVIRKTIFSFESIKLYYAAMIMYTLFPVSILCLGSFMVPALLLKDSVARDFMQQSLITYFLLALFAFSFLDADGNFWSRTALALKRTAKIIFYNAPVWIILFIFAYFIKFCILLLRYFLLNSVSEVIGVLFGIGMYMVSISVLVAIINTVYIKRVYGEKELYI